MPGRSFQATAYRYGFNGKENDNEVKGSGNQQDFGERIYDPRVGRFFTTDPLSAKYPYFSPYSYAGNSPIYLIDANGEGRELPLDLTLIKRLLDLRVKTFVDIIKKSNNFSLRALEIWGWSKTQTQQVENKVVGLAGEAVVASDLRNNLKSFTVLEIRGKKEFAPYLGELTEQFLIINATGDVDEDKTIDISFNVEAGKVLENGVRFGIKLPFVNSDGEVLNKKNGGSIYDKQPVTFLMEVKTGNSLQNFNKGMLQARRQYGKLINRAPMMQTVPVLVLGRKAFMNAIKNKTFKNNVDNFIKLGGRILTIDHLDSRAENLKEDVRKEIKKGTEY